MSETKNTSKEFRESMAVDPKKQKNKPVHPRTFIPRSKEFFKSDESVVEQIYTEHIKD